MEQVDTIYNGVLSQDENKPVIKEENIENRQLSLINKKKLKPLNSIQRSRFQKRLPNISSAAKRTLTPVVDTTSNHCEENKLKQSSCENVQKIEDNQESDTTNKSQNENKVEPMTADVLDNSATVESIHTNEENNQRQLLKESDVTQKTFPHNFETFSNEINSSTSATKKNATPTSVRRTPFTKKPVPNVRNVVKTISSSQEDISKSASAEKPRRLSGCHDEEPSTLNPPVVPNSVKFPHITSILTSKKRNVKDKEMPNKRRKYGKGDSPPERNKMTILDLIYYNPSENPMQCSKVKSTYNEIFVPKPMDETPAECNTAEPTDDTIRPVPKLVVNENGDINIDESSLFVQRNVPDPSLVETVTEETTYSSFRKKPSKQWGKNETAKFYRALSLVGTDFGLMEKLMQGRTRRELKLKFKREEKHNLNYINRAMYDSQTFDIGILLDDNLKGTEAFERNEIEENCGQKKVKGKRGRTKKRIDSSNSKTIVLSEESMDSNSQNSCEQSIAFEVLPECTSPDVSESSLQQASSPIHRSRIINTDLKMGETNSCKDNEIVEIEFAYSRRNRKPKLLAEGFIDTNDLEIDEKDEPYGGIPEAEMDCHFPAEAGPEENEIQPEENEILELQKAVERSGNISDAHATVDSTEQSNLIITNIGLSETDLVSNVIADEVVPSRRTYTKKSGKPNVNVTRRIYQKNPLPRLTFRKYTPTEEYPSYRENSLEFTPDTNLKTYARRNESNAPKCRNFLVSSLQSPSSKAKLEQDKETTSLITSLNRANNQSFVIPMTPEAKPKDSPCNSVMIFAKAPDQENILHLFMYNKADTELNTANCKVENVVNSS